MIEEKTLTKCSQEKDQAIHKTEQIVWEKADVAKQEAVTKALAQAQAQHENEKRKINKYNEKNLKVWGKVKFVNQSFIQ